MPKKIVPIKYTSREFDSIKESLVDYAKRYYPETFRDFSEASFGSLMLDTVAYVGDILSFYLDYQANESFLETAQEYENIIKLGKQLGYKFNSRNSSYGMCTFYLMCPSNMDGTAPEINYLPILKRKTILSTVNGSNFMLDEDVHFDHPLNEIRVARVSQETSVPTAWAVKAQGRIISGMINEEFINIPEYKKFRKVTLSNGNISEIISVIDSEGHEYYEVDFLSQDTIYRSVTNRNQDRFEAGEIIKPFQVARRFVTERSRNKLHLTFGASSDLEVDNDNIINKSVLDPSNVILKRHGSPYISDTSFDPNMLVESDEFGIAPSNTTLQITYRVNTTGNVNASANSVVNVVTPFFEFKNLNLLDQNQVQSIMSTLECTNESPITGDVTNPSGQELKMRILNNFSTQNRAVTAKDYEAFTYAMPTKFGAVKRCKVYRDSDSLKRNLNMYVVSESLSGNLAYTNDTIKENVKTWLSQHKMVNDTIDILDARIINLAINYQILGRQDMEKFEILDKTKEALKKNFVKHPEIGEPFFITDVYSILKNIEGVVDVINVDISLRAGGLYSDIRYNIKANLSPDGRYLDIPKNCIWEIRFLNDDINGVIK